MEEEFNGIVTIGEPFDTVDTDGCNDIDYSTNEDLGIIYE